jgi:hypothetical protein
VTGRPLGDANGDSRVGVIPEVLPRQAVSVATVGLKRHSGSPFPTHESGDVAVIQPIRKADAAHMCIDDGTQWVSDFKQPL